MNRCEGFPPYPMHKMAHDEYRNEFDTILAAWHANGDLQPLAHFLKETTPVWLQQHIATMDAVTANFFSMCE